MQPTVQALEARYDEVDLNDLLVGWLYYLVWYDAVGPIRYLGSYDVLHYGDAAAISIADLDVLSDNQPAVVLGHSTIRKSTLRQQGYRFFKTKPRPTIVPQRSRVVVPLYVEE